MNYFKEFGETQSISYEDLYKLVNQDMEKEMNKIMELPSDCFTVSNSATQPSLTVMNQQLKQLIDSLPKPPKVILSLYISDEFKYYFIPSHSEDEQDIYVMNPRCAKKILKMYPHLMYYIINPELLG